MINSFSGNSIDSILKIGSVFKLQAPELIGTDIPHYFIIMAIDEDEIYMVKCTTQKGKKEEYFKRYNLDLVGLVYIKPDKRNGLTSDSWINCNDYYLIKREKLIEKQEEKKFIYIGEISYNHYDQIRKGIKLSHVSDLPHDLLVHPED